MEITVFLLVIAVIAVFLLLRRPTAGHVKSASQRKRFAAVRVNPAEHACHAAFELSHRLFLASEAPLLPLQDCSKRENCRCTYTHYDDRRFSTNERRGDNVVMRDAYNKKERRSAEKRGRRKDD